MSARVRPRLILADDSSDIREALEAMLLDDYDIVAAVRDGAELVEAARRLQPDVIVSDMNMPRLSGLVALRRLRSEGSAAKFVLLTVDADPALAAQVLDAGGSAFVVKDSATEDLPIAIEEVLRGRTYLTPRLRSEQALRIARLLLL